MNDISHIPNLELLMDAAEAMEDAQWCRFALRMGVTFHRDGLPVRERLDVNERVIAAIKAEIDRRAAREEAIL